MNFADLKVDGRLVDILKARGITVPTEIQCKTYPLAANGHDVIGISQTGSGKTLAFVLPILNQVLSTDKPFHTLMIAPTRELTQQIAGCIAMFESLEIRWSVLVGGEPFNDQVTSINARPHIVVGTPGRIAKHVEKTKNFKIGSIRKLVLDEADRFFDQDFAEDLGVIASKLLRKNQTLMFTATITDKTERLSNLFMKNPRIVGNPQKYEGVETLTDSYSFIPEKYKITALCNYLKREDHGSTIVFVSMCRDAQRLDALLRELGLSSRCLHGNMLQPHREEVLRAFRASSFNVLVSTDLASRGLDIPHVDDIVNFDLPNSAKDYMHRVGRTARAGKHGSAVSFVTQYDLLGLQKLEFVLKRKLPEKKIELYSGNEAITEIYDRVSSELSEKNTKKRNK